MTTSVIIKPRRFTPPHPPSQHNIQGHDIFTKHTYCEEGLLKCDSTVLFFFFSPSTNVMTAHNSSLDSTELHKICRGAADTRSRRLGRDSHARLCRPGLNWHYNTATAKKRVRLHWHIHSGVRVFQRKTRVKSMIRDLPTESICSNWFFTLTTTSESLNKTSEAFRCFSFWERLNHKSSFIQRCQPTESTTLAIYIFLFIRNIYEMLCLLTLTLSND